VRARSKVARVITGDLKSKIDRVWDAFWSGGISNPLEVIEQITYLLFIRRLDDIQTLAEKRARATGKPVESPVFPPGLSELRWGRFKNTSPEVMFQVVGDAVFPFLRSLGDGTTYSEHMKDARFTIPTPALLSKVVDMLDGIPMADRDTNGDLYEYLLSRIASAGVNGQFRTPRHLIDLMVRMTAPTPGDELCDPAFMRKSDVSRDTCTTRSTTRSLNRRFARSRARFRDLSTSGACRRRRTLFRLRASRTRLV